MNKKGTPTSNPWGADKKHWREGDFDEEEYRRVMEQELKNLQALARDMEIKIHDLNRGKWAKTEEEIEYMKMEVEESQENLDRINLEIDAILESLKLHDSPWER